MHRPSDCFAGYAVPKLALSGVVGNFSLCPFTLSPRLRLLKTNAFFVMKPSCLTSTSSIIVALVIGGVALIAAALLFSFHDLEESVVEDGKQAHPSRQQEKSRSVPTKLSPASSIPEPATESSPPQTKTETSPDPSVTTGMDLVPPVGSEAPVPAVFGLLRDSNVTNLPVAEGLQGIAEEFSEKVKQGGSDATSEAYRINWDKATQEADDLLRARYGTEIYLELKRNAVP